MVLDGNLVNRVSAVLQLPLLIWLVGALVSVAYSQQCCVVESCGTVNQQPVKKSKFRQSAGRHSNSEFYYIMASDLARVTRLSVLACTAIAGSAQYARESFPAEIPFDGKCVSDNLRPQGGVSVFIVDKTTWPLDCLMRLIMLFPNRS